MPMLATLVQVEPSLLDDPSRVESPFAPELPAAFDPDRLRQPLLARGPQLLAAAMDLHPQLRTQIEASLGRSREALRRGDGGEAAFELMQRRTGGRGSDDHEKLELDKAWHGVHYVLCGHVDPGESLLSQAALGGTEIGRYRPPAPRGARFHGINHLGVRPRERLDSAPMEDRPARLQLLEEEASGCTRCRLAEGRTQVVFGVGNPDAELMFVGEAPGFHEDKQGYPFVGQAGKLLDKLLGGIGLTRADVYIANVLMCRPPGNRDPMPDEIEHCEPWLFRKIEVIQPKVIATLGNFATKLLSGKQLGITRVHGQEQEVTLGGRCVLLYPLYHPAAALYTPRMLQVLEEDFGRIPALISRLLLADEPRPVPDREHPELAMAAPVAEPAGVQLGLF